MTLLQCLSHSPLMDLNPVSAQTRLAIEQAISSARTAIQAFAPEICVIFFPDHYNAFSYRNMPQICVGAKARTIGDYGIPVFDLNVPESLALGTVEALLGEGFDPAISYDMRVDHAVAQPLTLLFDEPSGLPVIPVFVNSAAVPLGPFERSWDLGSAVGRYLRSLKRRVLILGSGGLSHDPPIPRMNTATNAQKERLIAGNLGMSTEDEAARQAMVSHFGRDFAEKGGTATGVHDLNPEWDNHFLDLLERADERAIRALDNRHMEEEAGRSVQEVRVWAAAFAALAEFGAYQVEERFYQAIPEWIAGFGMLRAKLV